MAERRLMDDCPKTDALRLIWFGKRTVPYVCLYMDQYVGQQDHHGWWSVDPRTGGMSPEWSEPREWQEIADKTVVHEKKVNCPVCHEPGMVCLPDRDEPVLTEIRCTNTCCRSNIPKSIKLCPECEGSGMVEGDDYVGGPTFETCGRCDGAKVVPQTVENGNNWIDCPLCESDDVRCTTTEAGSLIRCVNLSCPSNVLADVADNLEGPN